MGVGRTENVVHLAAMHPRRVRRNVISDEKWKYKMTKIEPYENSLSIEQLRCEVRELWDLQQDIVSALRDLPEVPPPWVLMFLSRANKWPEDNNLGKLMQRKYGLDLIPPKSECESGAGVWYRIRQGLLAVRPESIP
jgi:hypothetical protein